MGSISFPVLHAFELLVQMGYRCLVCLSSLTPSFTCDPSSSSCFFPSFPPCSSASSQSHPPQLLPSSPCTTFVHRPHCHLHQRPFSATDSDLLNDDADLTASLARARRVAQKTQALLATAEGDEDALDTGASRINTLLKSDQAFQPKKVPV